MTTTTHTTEAATTDPSLGQTSAAYAAALVLAVLRAGAPGTTRRLTHPTRSAEATAGVHACWSLVRAHLCGTTIDTYCVPTSTGVVHMVTTPRGHLRCLPTWGMPAADFSPAVLHLAREMATT